MSESNTEKKTETHENVSDRKDRVILYDALCREAKRELDRYGITELVSVSVKAVPDPEWPNDHLAMKIAAEVCDNFQKGVPAIDRDLDRVDAICSGSEEDLSLSLKNELLIALEERRKELAELREGKMNGKPLEYMKDPAVAALIMPSLENPVIEDPVWCIGWCVTKDDDGRLLVYYDKPLLAEYMDEDTWVRTQDRIRRINYILGGMMGRLLGEQE